MAVFVVTVAILLAVSNEGNIKLVAVSFIVGAFTSSLAGFFGMRVATSANMRTTNAARTGLAPALQIAFSGGSVMGMSVVAIQSLYPYRCKCNVSFAIQNQIAFLIAIQAWNTRR